MKKLTIMASHLSTFYLLCHYIIPALLPFPIIVSIQCHFGQRRLQVEILLFHVCHWVFSFNITHIRGGDGGTFRCLICVEAI